MKKIKIFLILTVLIILDGCNGIKKHNIDSAEGKAIPVDATPAQTETETQAPKTYEKIYITDEAGEILTRESLEESLKNAMDGVNESNEMTDEEFNNVLNNIAFIGDSVTSGFGAYQRVAMSEVFATPGISPTNIGDYSFDYNGGQYPVLTILNTVQPKYIVISMGLNCINSFSPESFAEEYMKFLDETMKTCPDSHFYVFALTPIAAVNKYDISNDKINEVNSQLEKTVSEHSGDVHFVDCNSILKDSTGYMNPEYSGGDGLHLNGSAYDVMLEELKKNIVLE